MPMTQEETLRTAAIVREELPDVPIEKLCRVFDRLDAEVGTPSKNLSVQETIRGLQFELHKVRGMTQEAVKPRCSGNCACSG